MMRKIPADLAQKVSYYKELDSNSYRGNVNNAIISTEKGKTIMQQYDITSPRVYLCINCSEIEKVLPKNIKHQNGYRWVMNGWMMRK